MFVITGLMSAVFWWRGRGQVQGETGWWEGWWKPVEIAFDVASPAATGVPAISTTRLAKQERLVEEIEDRVATASGTYAVYVYELESRRGWGFNEREKMSGASILKIPAMVAAVKKVESGEWTLGQNFGLTEADRSPGSGPLQFEVAGTQVSLERMLSVLGKNSDNTAWRMVNRLAGVTAIEDVMLAAGMTDSTYDGGAGDVTAVDVGKLWVKLYEKEAVGQRGKDLVWEYLSESIYEDRIPAGIPAGRAMIVHKVGTLADVWSDAGVVECEGGRGGECEWEPYVIVILNEGVLRAEATALVPWISQRVWEHQTGQR